MLRLLEQDEKVLISRLTREHGSQYKRLIRHVGTGKILGITKNESSLIVA